MPPLDSQKERFALLLVAGRHALDAYCEVYELSSDETRESPNVKDRARYLSTSPLIVSRVQELRAPVIHEVQQRLSFTIDQAMAKIDRAHDLAELMAEPAVMLKAIELQAKLHKLLGEDKSSVKGHLLDEHATSDLVMLLQELKARRQVECVVEGERVLIEADPAVHGGGVERDGPLPVDVGSVDCRHLL